MRCWKKRYSEEGEPNVPILPSSGATHWPPEWKYYVSVCGFTFGFSSIAQIAEYRAFYAQPLKPSFREWGVGADSGYCSGDHGEAQSAFARLPLYLWQKGKRERVVAGLERAIRELAKG